MANSRVNVLLPAENDGWELWCCNGSDSCSIKQTVADPHQVRSRDPIVYGIPADNCSTVVMTVPNVDPKTLRNVVAAQLERRGKTAPGSDPPRFEVHVVEEDDEEVMVAVDVIDPKMPPEMELRRASAYTASPRVFAWPENKAVVWREGGNLMLSAGRNGKLVYSHLIGPFDTPGEEKVRQIRLGVLGLEAAGVVDEVDEVVFQGRFDEALISRSRKSLPWEVNTVPRPTPAPDLVREGRSRSLLPPAVAQARQARLRLLAKTLLVLGLLGVYIGYYHEKMKSLKELEVRAATIDSGAGPLRSEAEAIKKMRDRWRSFRLVLEPKYYPLVHLTHISRVMPPGGVVLNDFETKVSEIKLKGEARTTREAFNFLHNLQNDKDLQVYNWGMPEPHVDDDGTARFEIKGKMR